MNVVSIRCDRQQLQVIQEYFFPYIKQLKNTRIQNIVHLPVHSPEYLAAIAVNCIVDECILHINRKVINTTKNTIKLQLSDAQTVVLYKTLLEIPVPTHQFYLRQTLNFFIELLDRELIRCKIYHSSQMTA